MYSCIRQHVLSWVQPFDYDTLQYNEKKDLGCTLQFCWRVFRRKNFSMIATEDESTQSNKILTFRFAFRNGGPSTFMENCAWMFLFY